MKYIVVGGDPFRSYTGTGTFTGISCIGFADTYDEARVLVTDNYDACGGLIEVFDTSTGEVPESPED